MGNTKFYRCSGCGNFVMFLGEKTACTPQCCGKPMDELKANTTDAAQEKHVPVVEISGSAVKVTVGATVHPMLEEHHIEFVYLETTDGGQLHYFKAGDEPTFTFELADGVKPVAAYEYCNLHGLWVKEL